MEDLKQAIIGFDWIDEKKGRAINRLTPETVAKLSGLPPGVVKAALEDILASGEAAILGEAPCCHYQLPFKVTPPRYILCSLGSDRISGKQTLGIHKYGILCMYSGCN